MNHNQPLLLPAPDLSRWVFYLKPNQSHPVPFNFVSADDPLLQIMMFQPKRPRTVIDIRPPTSVNIDATVWERTLGPSANELAKDIDKTLDKLLKELEKFLGPDLFQ